MNTNTLDAENALELAVVREIESELATHPLEVQHRVKNMASALREFVNVHGSEGHLAFALVGAKMAAGVL